MGRLNLGHYVIGMEGVALLRDWLVGGPRPDERVRRIAEFVAQPAAGLLTTVVDVPEKDVEHGYREWASTYDGLPNPLIFVEEPAVRALIDALPAGDAVDAACGTGRHAAYLAERGHRVIGVDTSAEMLDHARARVPAAKMLRGGLTALPVPSESADLVVCTLALTHVADLRPAIAELARVVRPDGHVILSDQHPLMTFLGGTAFYASADSGFAYVTSHQHWHSGYHAAFRAAHLAVDRAVEPPWTDEAVTMMIGGAGLAGIDDDAFRTALVGAPGALVWQLVRQ